MVDLILTNLVISFLFSNPFHSGTASNSALKITSVNLSIEPNANVIRNTSVTLRCKAGVLAYGTEAPNRVYTIYKDDNVIYNKTTSSSEDFFYNLPEARVSNNGKYRCMINIMGEKMASEVVTLTVTGGFVLSGVVL
ncbi:hypothetical protein ILYODFUR_020140 [Ilyodon furcidens]|uniref:Immunoglobulin domain-containing protein n=1 Tax=Ilyodon furcidens TaxID=33524 RepID=A0ABV0TKD0_9TELE